jgi:isohexenylglutaconyl-CoA hydratase
MGSNSRGAEAGGDSVRRGNRAFGTLLSRLKRIPQVLVAAIEGPAMGGGFGLACISDVALATADARFGTPEVTLGLVPAQIAPFLVERLGVSQTRRLTLTGATLDAPAACQLGLVHKVVRDANELEQEIRVLTARIMLCAPHAVARTKRLLSRVGEVTLGRLLDEAADLFAESLVDEGPEGIAAFLERRRPCWVPESLGGQVAGWPSRWVAKSLVPESLGARVAGWPVVPVGVPRDPPARAGARERRWGRAGGEAVKSTRRGA